MNLYEQLVSLHLGLLFSRQWSWMHNRALEKQYSTKWPHLHTAITDSLKDSTVLATQCWEDGRNLSINSEASGTEASYTLVHLANR